MDSSVLLNPMLGSQLVGKSMIKSNSSSNNATPIKCHLQSSKGPVSDNQLTVNELKLNEQEKKANGENNNNNNNIANICVAKQQFKGPNQQQMQGNLMAESGAQQQVASHLESPASTSFSAKDFELLNKESQELKIKTRKLQLEVDEKNEIISVLKDELETTKEQNDKFQRDNIQLLKDSKRVKFLQDENDFLQDRVGNVDKLELEIKRLKERLSELDFLKLRISELEEDRQRAQEDTSKFEEKWKRAESKLNRVVELESELNKWKLFSHDLESERNQIQSKLLESIEQETKLNFINKKVEDEVKRLRAIIKSFEEQRDEEQASTSLIISVADLKQIDQSYTSNNINSQQQNENSDISDQQQATPIQDTSIKFELDKQLERELNEENRDLKQKLNEHEIKFSQLLETNKEIRVELEGNKKSILELRQDLACEKSLNLNLTNKLTSFTRQIKNLDKHYFPMHDVSQTISTSDTQNEPATCGRKLCEISSNLKSSSNLDEGIIGRSSSSSSSSEQQNEKESSHLNDPMSFNKQLSKQQKEVLACEFDQKKINGLIANNYSEGKTIDNESKQQQQPNCCGSKLSALSKKSTQSHSRIDSSEKTVTRKQESIEKREIEKPELNVRVNEEAAEQTTTGHLTEPKSVAMNKSTDTLENVNKDKDESNSKFSLLSTSSATSELLRTSTTQGALDAKYTVAKILPTPSATNTEDELKIKKKHAYGSSNSSNIGNNGSSNIQLQLTSVKPDTSSSSLTPPVTVVTAEHDTGFQSINHDFNQFSPNDVDPKYILPPQSRTVDEKKSIENSKTVEEASSEYVVPEKPNRSKLVGGKSIVISEMPDASSRNTTPTQNIDKVPNLAKEINPISDKKTEGSQRMQNTTLRLQKLTASTSANNKLSSSSISHKDSDARKSAPIDKSVFNGIYSDRSSTNIKNNDGPEAINDIVKPKSSSTNRSFVRNSLPSRSVNFGHSRPTGYLDRIRASVIATTSTSTTSSFNEQTRNIVMSQQQQQQQQQAHQQHKQQQQVVSPFFLNCLLEHQHSEKCFVNNQIAHMRPAQVAPSCGSLRSTRASPMQSSRQLNALIDPVSHQHLMMNALYQGHCIPQHTYPNQVPGAYGLTEEPELTEQQIAHLTNLQHQHYYHHLQHMHQLHQMHHLHLQHHHMKQKCEQLKQKQASGSSGVKESQSVETSHNQRKQAINPIDLALNSNTVLRRNNEPIYSGGSQFYAPSPAQLDNLYTNMPANNNTYMTNENHCNRSRLVNGNNTVQPHSLVTVRSSPNRQSARISPHKNQQPQPINQYTLPQIDEVNGPPTGENIPGRIRCSPEKQLSNTQLTLSSSKEVGVESKQNSSPNNQTPSSSSSPTSSTSSHLSPSSASSSSSLNSLSISSAPLTRSALRHSTTEFTRRQYSVERELVNSIPMTATLSRVGSCRVKNLSQDATLMRNPVQSQQPSMRTSKILNISQQSGQQKLAPSNSAKVSTSSSSSHVARASDNDGNSNKSSVWFEYGCV